MTNEQDELLPDGVWILVGPPECRSKGGAYFADKPTTPMPEGWEYKYFRPTPSDEKRLRELKSYLCHTADEKGNICERLKHSEYICTCGLAEKLAALSHKEKAEIPDNELPGMWERADFTGGREEVRGPDWKPNKEGAE